MSGDLDEPRRVRADPDSRARTHLANERTFLAWLRTGLSMIALGLGAAQFLERDLIPGLPVVLILSSFLVLCGIAIAIFGGIHHAQSRERIERGEIQAQTIGTRLAISVIVVVGILAMILVVEISRHS